MYICTCDSKIVVSKESIDYYTVRDKRVTAMSERKNFANMLVGLCPSYEMRSIPHCAKITLKNKKKTRLNLNERPAHSFVFVYT